MVYGLLNAAPQVMTLRRTRLDRRVIPRRLEDRTLHYGPVQVLFRSIALVITAILALKTQFHDLLTRRQRRKCHKAISISWVLVVLAKYIIFINLILRRCQNYFHYFHKHIPVLSTSNLKPRCKLCQTPAPNTLPSLDHHSPSVYFHIFLLLFIQTPRGLT